MTTIYKYPLKLKHRFELELPVGAELLAFQYQESTKELCLWASVDTEAATDTRKFIIYGTGQPITDPAGSLLHIGTAQVNGYVWHLFEDMTL